MTHPLENSLCGPTILCVDDEPKVVDSLERYLRDYDIKVVKALHGLQGIWMAHTEKPDLVISDLSMPLADGFDLLDVVQHVPVIVLTGTADATVKRKLLDAGAVAVLSKPFNTVDLVAEIEKHISLEIWQTAD